MHDEHMKLIVKKQQRANMKILLEKSTFVKNILEVLGHSLLFNAMQIDPSKSDAINKYTILKTHNLEVFFMINWLL